MRTRWVTAASQNGELIFDNVRLSKENMLGAEGAGFDTINAIYETNGVGIGSMAVGVARAAYEVALAYAKEREIWGQPIGNYQAIGNMLVDMKADLEMARMMVRRVAWQADDKDSDVERLPPNMAKCYPAEMGAASHRQCHAGVGRIRLYERIPGREVGSATPW